MNNFPAGKGPEVLILHDEQHYVLDRLTDFKGVILLPEKREQAKQLCSNYLKKFQPGDQ